jgi:PAS domain S-box-containing protein
MIGVGMEEHRLKQELFGLIKTDATIFEFVERSSLDGLWYWDLESPEHEWMSDKFWHTLGYDPSTKQHLAAEWQDIINQDDLAVAQENFKKHCANPSYPYDQEVRYRHSDGSTVWVRCRGLAIRDETGKPIRMIGAHNDITAFKEEERKTRHLIKSRERFFARMSHEIRTPLHGMIGITQVLQEWDVEDKVKTQLDTMLQCGQQLQHLLNDLLTLSKIDENKFSVSIEDTLLGPILRYVEALYEPIAADKKLMMVFPDNGANDTIIRTDRVRLTQILSNLVSNAIKFTFRGAVQVGVVVLNKHIKLVVQDTGDGMADVDAALKAYHQGHITDDFHVQGTGLGLEIVHKLCQAMDHPLNIESTLGIGTNVTITIPLSDIAKPKMRDNDVISEARFVTKKPIKSVLIVDDNEINREIAYHMLKDTIAQIDTAENGKIAVQKTIANKGYDVILMDLNMPVKNGYEASREIKALPSTFGQSRIIALTADAFEDAAGKCDQVGMHQRITKPFTKERLVNAVLGQEV